MPTQKDIEKSALEMDALFRECMSINVKIPADAFSSYLQCKKLAGIKDDAVELSTFDYEKSEKEDFILGSKEEKFELDPNIHDPTGLDSVTLISPFISTGIQN